MVSKAPFTGEILGISYHCFFQALSRLIISAFVSVLFFLHLINEKMECDREHFLIVILFAVAMSGMVNHSNQFINHHYATLSSDI
jgi:hypothetical protein